MNKNEASRFHPSVVVPETPDGMKLIKFHGNPALIPARRGREKLRRSIIADYSYHLFDTVGEPKGSADFSW